MKCNKSWVDEDENSRLIYSNTPGVSWSGQKAGDTQLRSSVFSPWARTNPLIKAGWSQCGARSLFLLICNFHSYIVQTSRSLAAYRRALVTDGWGWTKSNWYCRTTSEVLCFVPITVINSYCEIHRISNKRHYWRHILLTANFGSSPLHARLPISTVRVL